MAAKKKAPVKKVATEVAPKPVVKKKSEEELIKEARALWGPFANKTRAYLQFVKDNKADMPNEYKFAESLIKRYLGE